MNIAKTTKSLHRHDAVLPSRSAHRIIQVYDVHCGCRGNYIGNRRFAVLLSMKYKRFASAKLQSECKDVAASVVHAIKTTFSPPGRFLMLNHKNEWTCLTHQESVAWVYRCFQVAATPKKSTDARKIHEIQRKLSTQKEKVRLISPSVSKPGSSLPAQAVDLQLAKILLLQHLIFEKLAAEEAASVSQNPQPHDPG